MDNYDLKPEKKVKFNSKAFIWNVLTVLVLLGILCLGYFFLTIFMNPNSRYNPFPPRPTATLYMTDTPTITPIQLPPTYTPSLTVAPTETNTRFPTWTLLPELITPTITETPTETQIPSETTTPQLASAIISYKASTEVHPTSDCTWFGVGGQVLNASGKPLQNQTLQLGGTLGDKTIQDLKISGITPKSLYGDAGFEFLLGTAPVDSKQTLWIQLFDNTSLPLTQKLYFDTFADCTKNLIYIVFTVNR